MADATAGVVVVSTGSNDACVPPIKGVEREIFRTTSNSDLTPEEQVDCKHDKLKALLLSAIEDARLKVLHIDTVLNDVRSEEAILEKKQLFCILASVREALKEYPEPMPYNEKSAGPPPKNKVEQIVGATKMVLWGIRCRLALVEDFIRSSPSPAKTMTVAFTIRDITKTLKSIVLPASMRSETNSPREGQAHNHLSGSGGGGISGSGSGRALKRGSSVMDRIRLFEKIDQVQEEEEQEQADQPQAQAPPVVPALAAVPNADWLAPVSGRKKEKGGMTPNGRVSGISAEQLAMDLVYDKMDEAVEEKLTTLTKQKAGMFKAIMEAAYGNDAPEASTSQASRSRSPRQSRNDRPLRCGSMTLRNQKTSLMGKTNRPMWVVLKADRLLVFKSKNAVEADKTLDLQGVSSITQHMPGSGRSVMRIVHSNKEYLLADEEERSLFQWMISIDAMATKTKGQALPCIADLERRKLFEVLYKTSYKGGVIKSSYEEEWQYFGGKKGLLKSDLGVDDEDDANAEPLKFEWSGETLVGKNDRSRALGMGRWTGVSLIWFAGEDEINKKAEYSWIAEEAEYSNVLNPKDTYKWTRHFLAAKFGVGEWITEGGETGVPRPVVMFLQVLRNVRLANK
eukprot:TRINITY_DN5525_c1_g1_i2.p1 TRINITY_DN5525_c1_g1~~TRINITY_DN5525_c1_g1_i2.p1  ORF type:complete len:625 (+),score=182.01 TRINITY_DN5525_c1_g1_i2:154-2028(+)